MQTHLEFTWSSSVDSATFICDMDLLLGRESLDDQLVELMKWLRTHLKSHEYQLDISRTDTVRKHEALSLENGKIKAVGGTVFKPWRLRVNLTMPIRQAAIFSMAFSAKQTAEVRRPRVQLSARQISPFVDVI